MLCINKWCIMQLMVINIVLVAAHISYITLYNPIWRYIVCNGVHNIVSTNIYIYLYIYRYIYIYIYIYIYTTLPLIPSACDVY